MIICQENLFSEDKEEETLEYLRKYFDSVFLITDEDLVFPSPKKSEIIKEAIKSKCFFRGSLALAKRLGRKFSHTNALEWLPSLRKYALNKDYSFLDFKTLLERVEESGLTKFVRPCSGFKEFSGNIYTPDTLRKEYNFAVKQKNISPYIICQYSEPKPIHKEWRVIFVNARLIDGSQYMENFELKVVSGLPSEVKAFASIVSTDDFFINNFEYVLDICESNDELFLLEINAFETASFYGADRNLIYSTLANEVYVS